MLLYFIICRPFKGTWDNILNIFNEAIIFFCFGTILLINLYPVNSDVIDILGYLLLALIAVGFVLCLMAMGISTIKAFQKKDKDKGKGKKKEKAKSNNLQDSIKKQTNAIGFEGRLSEIEESRLENNGKTTNVKYFNKGMFFS